MTPRRTAHQVNFYATVEVIDRVSRCERFVILRRGTPAVALVPPEQAGRFRTRPELVGLAAVAGALEDWDEIDAVVAEIYAARRRARGRPVPKLE